jgi:hypothetical protein
VARKYLHLKRTKWRIVHVPEFRVSFVLPVIFRVVKSRTLLCGEGSWNLKSKECTCNLAEEFSRETSYLEDMRWVDNMKVDYEGGRLMELAQDHAQWRAVIIVLVLAFEIGHQKVCSVPLL